MAGFFGLFNYDKPGKGVDKNAPPKKRFFLFFELYFRKFWKILRLSFLYFAFFVPAIAVYFFTGYLRLPVWLIFMLTGIFALPVGAASAGCSLVLRNMAREDPVFLASDFFDGVKNNWKQATAVCFIDIAVAFLAVMDIGAGGQINMGAFRSLYVVGLIVVFSLYLFMHYYIYTMMVTFELKLRRLYKNAFILALAGLGRNVFITLILGFLTFAFTSLIRVPILILMPFLMGTYGFIISFISYPLLKKVMLDPAARQQEEEAEEAEEAGLRDTAGENKF